MAHIHDKIDFTIGAFIVFEGKVLLIFHKKLQKWLPVGGHIELDEDPDEALLREIQEECGVAVEVVAEKADEIDSPDGRFLFRPEYVDIHRISETHQHVCNYYFCRAKSSQVKLAEKEHDEIKWFSRQELDMPEYSVLPKVKFYAVKALEKLR